MIDFVTSVFKGMYPYFAIPAVFVILYRIKQKYWTSMETLLLFFVIFHALIEIFQIVIGTRVLYMSRRYLLPCAPIIFGWLAWGIIHMLIPRIKKCNYRIKQIFFFIILIVISGLIFDGIRPVIRSYTSSKKKHERYVIEKLSPKIKQIVQSIPDANIKANKGLYIAPYSARIGSNYPALAYWSRGRYVCLPNTRCDILVLKSNEKIPPNFLILFSEEVDNVMYYICIQKERSL